MRHLKFLQIVLALTLCACTSCEEDDKLPGTKPEILIGKWEGLQKGGLFDDAHIWMERYEFTETGGFMIDQYYDPIKKILLEPDTFNYFADWSYLEGEDPTIYFKNYRGSRWELSVYKLASDSIIVGCHDCIYYKIKE